MAHTGDTQIINDIAFLVDQGYLSLDVFPVALQADLLSILKDISSDKRFYDASGGGNNHIALKLLGADFLKNRTGLEAKFEHPYHGYFPDVISSDDSTIIECGHTNNPGKIYIYFSQGNLSECIMLPYPDHEREFVYGYSFKPGKDLKEFLEFWESEKRAELLKKLGR